MLMDWIQLYLLPFMILKYPNKRHSAYELKHIAEKAIGRYVSQLELQEALHECGYPVSQHYPISEHFFKYIKEVSL